MFTFEKKLALMRPIAYLSILGSILFCTNVSATTYLENSLLAEADTIVPKVFMIGEYEPQFEKLIEEHEFLLLTACNNDMNLAFEKWSSMLVDMEEHSDAVNYDLKGVKVWLNIFWAADGHIKHIAFYLKPNSRNVDTEKLTLFFISFINNYQFPLMAEDKYSHYGVASFPTFFKPVKKDNIESDKTGPLVKDSVNSIQNDKE